MRKFYSALLMWGDKAEDANVLFPFQKCHICLQGENIFLKQLSSTFWAIFLVASFFFALQTIWREEGLRAFYRSFPTALVHNMPFQVHAPKLLWIRRRQYCDIGKSKQQLKRKWKWEVFSVGCLCEGWRDEGQGVIEVDSAFEIKIKKFRLGAEEK